ncbi:MAG: insulinase family protein, partial [Oligoflexia bacterium]|nr:insulinase family protein [Oligoflexia bacterium]
RPEVRLVSLMVCHPALPEGEIDNVRSLFLQDLAALQDNPARRVMIALGNSYYPEPWGRSPMGTEDGLKSVTHKMLVEDHKRRIRPRGAILSIAGNVKVSEVRAWVEECFGAWSGSPEFPPSLGKFPDRRENHIHSESAQLQIALAYPSARFGDKHYYAAKVATGILSGGMFGRLFIEVREKRGLCYSVRASHSATAAYGTVVAYAGTTPERAHETLDVMVEVLEQMKGDILQEELERSQIDLKASRIIGEESTAARAVGNATDWWLQKRVRPLQEVLDGIAAVSAEQIHEYLKIWPVRPFALMTLGPRDLHSEAR